MSDKTNRRRLQFSLKTLLAAMVLAGGVAGVAGRMWNLHRLAVFHKSESAHCDKEAELAMDAASLLKLRDRQRAMDEYLEDRRQIQKAIRSGFLLAPSTAGPKTPVPSEDFKSAVRKHDELEMRSRHHSRLSGLYSQAVYRPWTVVDESPPETNLP